MKYTLYLLILLGFTSVSQAQVNEAQLQKDAETLFEAGKFVEAHPLYAQLVSLNPRNVDYNFRFGASTVFAGSDYETAIKHLKFATHKTGVDARAFYYMGLAEQLNYDFSSAIDDFNNFKNLADAKTSAGFDVNRRIDQCKNGQGLLSKVKDIVVIEKTTANDNDFFRFFNLDAMGGRILAMPEELKTKTDIKKGGNSLIYYPGSTSVIYFSSYGKDGSEGKDLYRAYLLPDGSFSKTEILKGKVNTPFDEDYPFMHPDGKTLYFCSKGHSSMGGYDVFRSIYDPSTDSFSSPENLDFAINTPDDEFLFVTDSLSNLACFASGRSSALGELNVYKVRVEGIPVQVVFIQGKFFSEINPDSKKVKISVKDELTGRPIENTHSSISSGEYVISLPKSGKYLFEVETENSPIIHEGIVEVPVFGEPVVLRQELRIVNEGGAERLVINNQFDTPLTDRIAEYTAKMMRKKAGLEVNATDELLASLDAADKMTVEINAENAPMLAGFSDKYSVGTIVSEIRAESQKKAEAIDDLKSKSTYAAGFAKAEFEAADKLLKEAEQIKTVHDGSKSPEAIEKLRESQRKATEAEKRLMNAKNALAIADSTMNYSSRISADSKDLAQKASAIESESDPEKLVEILKQEKGRRETSKKKISTPGEHARQMAELKELESSESLVAVNRLRAEESEINTSIKKAEREKESAKSKDKPAIDNRISQLNQEKSDLQSRITAANEKARSIESVSNDFSIQSDLYNEIVLSDSPESIAKPLVLNATQKSELQASIEKSESKVGDIKITDPETLALIGEGSNVSRSELTTAFKLPPKSVDSEISLKPVAGIQEDYVSSYALISTEISRPEMAYKANLIQANAIQNAELRKEYVMKSIDEGKLDKASADTELQQLNEFISGIKSEDPIAYSPKTKTLTSAQQNQILKDLSREYQSFKPEGVAWKDDLQKLTFSQASIEAAEAKIAENNQKILTSTNPDQIKNWLQTNEELSVFILDQPNSAALNTVDDNHKAAIQSIGASKIPFAERIQKQVVETERYLELLDAYEAGLNETKINSSEKEKLEYTNAIAQVNKLKEAAQLRLSGLKSDSEIAALEPGVSIKPVVEGGNDNTDTAQNRSTNDPSQTGTQPNTVERTANSSTETQINPVARAEETPVVAEQSSVNSSNPLPKEKTKLILALMPNYPLEGSTAASNMKSLNERAEVEKTFIGIITENIQEREKRLVLSEVPAEKEKTEMELVQLRALKRQSELQLMEWNAAASTESEEVVAADLGMTTALNDQERSLFETINSPAPSEDAKSAYESTLYDELVSENTDASTQINNREAIESVHADIAQKETELRSEESESKQKKLDRKIEDLYVKVAFMEMGNGSKLKTIAEKEYTSNAQKIEDLSVAKFDLVKSNSYYDDKIDEHLNKAEDQMKDAEEIRKNAVRIGDPIEKNYLLREAFALESEAIQNQRRALLILENVENLNGKEEVYLASLNAESKAASNQELTAETNTNSTTNSSGNQEAANPAQSTNAVENAPTQNPVVELETTVPDDSTEFEIEETVEAEPTTAASLPPARVMNSQLSQRINTIQDEDPLSGANLSAEEIETRRRSEAYVRYQKLLNEAENRKLEIESTLSERAQILEQTKTIEAQIAKLDISIENETDPAIKAGLVEEKRRLRSQAQVNYSRLELLDKKIAADEVFLGGILDEATVVAEKLRKEPQALPPSAIASASPDARAKSAEVRNYLFENPETLTKDVFAVFDSAPYSANSPIPINPKMPAGVVFKVQVGAFRNDIPQDLFGGFAPISGESLNSGITRYTVGLFRQFNGANMAKSEIQTMGYPDAFVVAFIDGIRVPLYEALAQLDQGDVADSTPSNSASSTSNPENNSTSNSTVAEAPGNSTSQVKPQPSAVSENLSNKTVGKEFDPSREDVDYYEKVEGAAKANQVEVLKGLFYTVQVGVYSKVVTARDLNNISPLNSESTTGGRVRYTTGVFNNLTEASQRKSEIIIQGISDAFVTAYYNGQRITLAKAADLYEELGPNVLNVTNALSDENAINEWEFDVFIGRFSGEVPANVAKAMLFLEESRGIVKRNSSEGVEYYSGRVNSVSSAKLIQSDFARYDVNSTEIIGYENGLRKSLDNYTGE